MIQRKECSLKRGFAVKEVDLSKKLVIGYFSAFGNVDSDGDIMMPGAFAKTIQERGPGGTDEIKHLRQHSRDDAFGRIKVLKEDATGLYFETEAYSTARAQDTLVLYQEGFFNQHSVGFQIIQGEWSESAKAFQIKEVRLWEGSAVTWGANPKTPVSGIKGAFTQEELDEYLLSLSTLKSRMEKYIRTGQKGTDDLFITLQKQIQEIDTLLKSATEPSKDTQPEEEKARELIEYFKNSVTL